MPMISRGMLDTGKRILTLKTVTALSSNLSKIITGWCYKKEKTMDKIDAIKGLIRPFISVVFVSTVCYLSLKGKIEPGDILQLTGIIVAFHFGERSANINKEEPKP